MPTNDEIIRSESFFQKCWHCFFIVFLFPIYTMLLSYILFFYLLYNHPRTRIPLILYYTYIQFFDVQPSKSWRHWWPYYERCRNWACWKLALDYFPNSKLVKTAPLPPTKNYLICYHPHGIISMGLQLGLALNCLDFTSVFPSITRSVCTLVASFKFPFFRELILMNGYVDCNRHTLKSTLSLPGESLVLVPGGANEALHSQPGKFKLHILKRFGFVKVAIQTGASLVPCLGFGENDLFSTVDNQSTGFFSQKLYKIQVWCMKKCSFSAPLLTQFFPNRVSLICVVGAPIDVEKVADPSVELVGKVHAQYVKALVDLYEKHKAEHGNGVELELT